MRALATVGFDEHDGSVTTYGYDTLNRLNGLANSWAGSFGFGYDALSRRTSLTRPNGVNTSYSYDGLSHLLSVLHQVGNTVLDGASYSYDSAGNRTSKTNYLNGATSNYSYDPLYELTQVTQGGSTTESYSYDAVGNRLSSSSVPNYNYNVSNELTSNSNGSYTYDANGNTLNDAQGRSFTWDFENRLTQVVNPGVGTTSLRYDPFGRRIQKSGPLGTTNYLYDWGDVGADVIEEVDNSGSTLARYTQGIDIDQPYAEFRSGTIGYYQGDALNSITSVTNAAAAVDNTYVYDSYGNTMQSSGSLPNHSGYTAREFDTETGLLYNRLRYYDPNLGRFVNEDPSGLGGSMNFYAYVNNSPISNVDPLGLAICTYFASSGWLWCFRQRAGHDAVIIRVASGNNGGASDLPCKNNHKCDPLHDTGPIPRGWWIWTTGHTGKKNGRVLIPGPGTYDWGRDLIRSHSCANPFSNSTPYCSGGCITGKPGDIKDLNKLIDSEPGSKVFSTD